jgi:hypothetical protein
MSTHTSTVDARPAVDPAVPKPPAATPHDSPEWIPWLFRDALRNHHVHPLEELVRRYREKDAS